MAKQTKSTSGNTSTYIITDQENNTITVAATLNPGSGMSTVFTSSGGLLNDGMAMLAQLLLLISTNLLP